MKKLTRWRKDASVTQRALANMAGIPQSMLSRCEQGRGPPLRIDEILRLCIAMAQIRPWIPALIVADFYPKELTKLYSQSMEGNRYAANQDKVHIAKAGTG